MLTLKDVRKFQVIHKLSTVSKNLDSLELTKHCSPIFSRFNFQRTITVTYTYIYGIDVILLYSV